MSQGTLGYFSGADDVELLQANTRGELLSLISSSALIPGKVYCFPTGWVLAGGTGTWCSVATSANTLATRGWYESPTLNAGKPWPADYDINNDRVYWMQSAEQYENEVSGDTEVRSFPWDKSTVRHNKVHHSTFTYTGTGVFQQNNLTSGARVRVDGAAQVYRSEFSSYCNVSLVGDSRVEDSAIANESALFMDGGRMNNSCLGSAAYYDLRGWTGTINTATSFRGRLYLSGTGTFNEFTQQGLAYFYARNVVNVLVQSFDSAAYGYAYIDRAEDARLRYINLESVAYFYARDSKDLYFRRSRIAGNSRAYFDSSDGFTAEYWEISGSSNLYARRATGVIRGLTLGVASTLNIDDADLSRDWRHLTLRQASSIDARQSTARVRACDLSANSYIRLVGGSPDIQNSNFKAQSRTYLNGTDTIIYTSEVGKCYFNAEGSAGVAMRNSSLSGYAYLDLRAAPSGRIDHCDITSYGRLRVRNTASAGWWVYVCVVNSVADLRMVGAGRVNYGTFSSNAVATFTHAGTVNRPFIMQTSTTQSVATTNLRLHSGGPF